MHLLKQKETLGKPTQDRAVPKEPARGAEKEPVLRVSPLPSADSDGGQPLRREGARALTELMKASPLGRMSMSSEPLSARKR